MEVRLSDSKSLDILGIKPVGDAAREVTSAVIGGVSAFLSRICLPVAEEFGLVLRDRVRIYRTTNMVAIARAAERKLDETGAGPDVSALPRLVSRILDDGSWIEDSEVQEMWGGLLASACSESGDDDSNLLFVNLLAGLTGLQARILRYACEQSKKVKTKQGLVQALPLDVTLEMLFKVTGEQDIQRLDREMDNLRAHELLDQAGGFSVANNMPSAGLTPTALALHMYVRGQGVRSSPIDYFGITEVWEVVGDRIWRPVQSAGSDSTAPQP